MSGMNTGGLLVEATRGTGAGQSGGYEIPKGATKVAIWANSPASAETGVMDGDVQFSADGTNWANASTPAWPSAGTLSQGETTFVVYDVEGAFVRLDYDVATSNLTFSVTAVAIG